MSVHVRLVSAIICVYMSRGRVKDMADELVPLLSELCQLRNELDKLTLTVKLNRSQI